MSLEDDLEKAKKEGYWLSIVTKSQNSTYGKVSEIGDGIVKLCPYHYISTPFGSVGGEELYFKRVEDKEIPISIDNIDFIIPMPDEVVEIIEEKAAEIIDSKKKKTGFK